MDRLSTVVGGRRRQRAGATSAFLLNSSSHFLRSYDTGSAALLHQGIIGTGSIDFHLVFWAGFGWSSATKIVMGRRCGNSLEPLQFFDMISSSLIIKSSRDRTTWICDLLQLGRPGQLEPIALPRIFLPPHQLFPSLADMTHTCGIGLGNQLLARAADVKDYTGESDVT